MLRTLLCPLVVAAALAAVPAALADGGPLPAVQGGSGLLTSDGSLRYLALPGGGADGASEDGYTTLASISTRDGSLRTSTALLGSWGLPTFGLGSGVGDALSADGTTLALAKTTFGEASAFLLLNAKTLALRNWVVLRGMFSFDALSPDASRLYLIQYVRSASGDIEHYVVRAYDLRTDRLVPGRIADRTQRSWVMQGYPVTRTASDDGRFVYTLYQNPGGYPFVHSLDTVRGVAHCVGLPYTGNQNGLYNVVLSLRDGGRSLSVHWRSGRPWLTIETAGWRVAPAGRGGFPWRWPGIAAAALVLAAGGLALGRRRLQGTRLAPAA